MEACLCFTMWSILENVPCVLEKKVYSGFFLHFFDASVVSRGYQLSSTFLSCHFCFVAFLSGISVL